MSASAATATILRRAEDLRPGDVVVFLGTPHLVSRIEEYTHPAFPEAFGIARASDGWGISLSYGMHVDVATITEVQS